MNSLYNRLGGEEAIQAVVETFYAKVVADERIKHFFNDVEMSHQITKQKLFLSMVFGGPANYSGRALRHAHTDLVKRGLNDMHFDAVVELLGAALKEHGVDDNQVKEVAAIAESVRHNILGR